MNANVICVGNRCRRCAVPRFGTGSACALRASPKPAFIAKQLGHTLQVFYSTYARWIESEEDRDQLEIAMR